MTELSIIIPCYNSASTLADTVECFIREFEGYITFQIIIVNDGSTDHTDKIANSLAETYSQVSVYSTENKGVSSARNFGLTKAEGTYIWFFDSDDLLFDGVGKELTAILKRGNADLIRFNSVTEDFTNKNDIEKFNNTDSHKIIFNGRYLDFLKQNIVGFSVWGIIVKSSILINNSIKFHDKLALCEDVIWNLEIASSVCDERLLYSNLKVVRYIVRPNSELNTVDSQRNLRLLKGVISAYDCLMDLKSNDKIKAISASIENFEDNFHRLMVTRFLSCNLKYTDIKHYSKEIYSRTKGNKSNKIVRLFSIVHSFPIVICVLQFMYRNLFLRYIKPRIGRN